MKGERGVPIDLRAPTIRLSARFLANYQRSSAALQARIEGEVHDFVRGFRSDPRRASYGYDRLAHFKPERVLELEVGPGDRALAHFSADCLVLLDVGQHEITRRYLPGMLAPDLRDAVRAPARFWPDGKVPRLFADFPDEGIEIYGREMDPEWVYSLSDEQGRVVTDIVNRWGEVGPDSDRYSVHFVIGGPGTGKTSVLLNLLKEFYELQESVGIRVSSRLADYIRASLKTTALDHLAADLYGGDEPEILLIDDPRTHAEVYWPLKNIVLGSNEARMVVVAFDPCQLHDSLSDAKFEKLAADTGATIHNLETCYRQKRNVGRAAQKAFGVIAESSAFLAEDKVVAFRKEHADLTGLANNTRFVNPRGYVKSYLPNATIDDLKRELKRTERYPKWRHWPGLAAIVDSTANMPQSWIRLLAEEGAEVIPLEDIDNIKGLEYQHVFLFFGAGVQEKIARPVFGQTQAGYFNTRLLRIPLSRAKDSLVIFGLRPAG